MDLSALSLEESGLFANLEVPLPYHRRPMVNRQLRSLSLFLPLSLSCTLLYAGDRSRYSAGEVEYLGNTPIIPTITDNFQYTADVNLDGYTDVLILGFTPVSSTRRGGNPGVILLNNGDNTFTPATGDIPMTEWPREILVADFNSDGIADIFIADHGWDADPFPGYPNHLLLGTGSGFTDASDRLPGFEDFSHNAAQGDIDGDGDIDIIVANTDLTGEEVSYFLINDGSANFSVDRTRVPARLAAPTGSSVTLAAELSDLDSDGAPELIIGQEVDNGGSTSFSEIYWNDGLGNFSATQRTVIPEMTGFQPAGGYQVIDIKTIDVDGDSDKDILLTANDTDFVGIGVQLMINQGNRSFEDRSQACLAGEIQSIDPTRKQVYFFKFADINFDGQTDIILERGYDTSGRSILALENSGGSKYRAITFQSLNAGAEAENRLWAQPLIGNGVFGIGEFFTTEENGQPAVGLNYVPINATKLPSFTNYFDACTNQLKTQVDAAQFGKMALNFLLKQSSPTIVVQAVAESAEMLSELPDGMASFDPATGKLLIPELVVDEEVAYTNLEFTLIDGDQLLFQLTGSD